MSGVFAPPNLPMNGEGPLIELGESLVIWGLVTAARPSATFSRCAGEGLTFSILSWTRQAIMLYE